MLVVEDEAVQALDLTMALRSFGCRVLGPASSVANAAELLDKVRPNLALLDIVLQDGPVEPLAERLAAIGIPFALVTGYGDLTRTHPLLAGAPRLDKPYWIIELGRCVRRLFQTNLKARLARVELQIAQAEERLARQAPMIQRLTKNGQDTALAEKSLRGTERSLELMRAHWNSLVREQFEGPRCVPAGE